MTRCNHIIGFSVHNEGHEIDPIFKDEDDILPDDIHYKCKFCPDCGEKVEETK